MLFFKDCTDIAAVKALYRTLAKDNHPDRGGDLRTMQAINTEYAFAVAKLAKGGTLTDEEVNKTILDAEQYAAAVAAIAHLDGIIIELVGGWIWVSGDTKPHKDILNAAKFRWASKKFMWYFRSESFSCKGSRKSYHIDDIRAKYGSERVRPSRPLAFAY